jgi:drug/metabolite transporter (DMT)-like permease
VFTFLAPVFALIIGNLYFDESLERLNFIGVFLSLIGIYLVSYQPSKNIN